MRKNIVIVLLIAATACKSVGKRAGFTDTFIRQDSGKVSVTFDTLIINHHVQQLGTYVITRRVRTDYFSPELADRFEIFQYIGARSPEGKSLVIKGSQRTLHIDETTGNLFSGSNEYNRMP